jgi:hypothetical protein
MRASSVRAKVSCASVEIVTIDRLSQARAVNAAFRLAKVSEWANLVVALSSVTQVECANVVIVTILVGVVDATWGGDRTIAVNSPAGIIGDVTVQVFQALVWLAIFNARIDDFTAGSRAARLLSVVARWVSCGIEQANNVLAFLWWTVRSKSTIAGVHVTCCVRASVCSNTFWSEITALRVGRVGVGSLTLVGGSKLALWLSSLVQCDATVYDTFLGDAIVVRATQ